MKHITRLKWKKVLVISFSIFIIITVLLFILFNHTHILSSYGSSDFRSCLEIIYFISSPLILIVSVIALRQINVTVSSIEISSKRDATKLTAEQCKQYLSYVIPLINKLNDFEKEIDLKTYGTTNVENAGKSISGSVSIDKKVKENISSLSPLLAEVLNALEAFSIYIISGVTEENLAFISVGCTFCDTVKSLYPVILYLSQDKYYKNIISLYEVWNSRIQRQDIKKKMVGLEKDLNSQNNYTIGTIGYKS